MKGSLSLIYLKTLTVCLLWLTSAVMAKIPSFVEPKRILKPQMEWAKNLDGIHQTGNLSLSLAGVALSQGLVFVGDTRGFFWAFDQETGRVIWKVKEKHAIQSTPLISEGQVLYGTQFGRLLARDMRSGKLVYSVDLGSPIEAQPVEGHGRLIVYLRGHQVVCLDRSTGKILWNYRRAVPVTVTLQKTSPPLIYDQKIYLGFADGYAGALSLQDGSLIWEQKIVEGEKFVDVDSAAFLHEGLIYMYSSSGYVHALDPLKGEVKRILPFHVLTPIVKVNEGFVFGTYEGEILKTSFEGDILLKKKLSPKGINQLAKLPQGYAVSDLKGQVWWLNEKDFSIGHEWSLGHSQSSVFGLMAVEDNKLSFMSSRSRLYFLSFPVSL